MIQRVYSMCSAGVCGGGRPRVCPSPKMFCRDAYCSEVSTAVCGNSYRSACLKSSMIACSRQHVQCWRVWRWPAKSVSISQDVLQRGLLLRGEVYLT
jgi:hypothetical protein